MYKNLPQERERQIHADNISTQQPPCQASTSSVKTQPLSYRGPKSPEKQRDKLQDTYSTWWCRTDTTHSSSLHPSTRSTKTTHTPEGGEFWALSYTWSPSSHFHCFLPILRQLTHWSRPKLAPTPNEDWYPEKTQNPPRQTSSDTTDDAYRYFAVQQHQTCQSLCPSCTVLGYPLLAHCLRQHISGNTLPTLADAEPTDPIDESHPEPSCSQSHWLQHKTTDEDKTLLTTPWSTLKAHSCVPFHTDIHFFLSLFPSHLPSPLVFWLHPC